jgi:hypothetical protein
MTSLKCYIGPLQFFKMSLVKLFFWFSNIFEYAKPVYRIQIGVFFADLETMSALPMLPNSIMHWAGHLGFLLGYRPHQMALKAILSRNGGESQTGRLRA